MDIFGIGPTELVFIILIALIVLGPKGYAKDRAHHRPLVARYDHVRQLARLPGYLA